jgi:hypothetical protein
MPPVAKTFTAKLAASLARIEMNISIVTAHNLLGWLGSSAALLMTGVGSFAQAINRAISGSSGIRSISLSMQL